MDPEQTFLRVHARFTGMLAQLVTPRLRSALEYLYLGFAIALFCVLVVMHTNFVQQPGCSSELSAIEFTEAQIVQIKITGAGLWSQNVAELKMVDMQKQESSTEGYQMPDVNGDGFSVFSAKFWTSWLGSNVRRSKLVSKFWKGDKEFLDASLEHIGEQSKIKPIDEKDIVEDIGGLYKGHLSYAREALKATVLHLFNKWRTHISSLWETMRLFSVSTRYVLKTTGWNAILDIPNFLNMFQVDNLKSHLVQWLEKRSKAFEPTYLYTVEKGYFLLPERAKSRHNLQTINITLSAQNSCFGNRWQQLLINSFVGYDTILMNSLLNTPGQGYLYNYQTKEFYDLSYHHELSGSPARFGDYFVTKCGVLIMSLFVFFTTTMSVSFTLRETQSRMLRFTVQLQHHARHRLPTFQLIFVHVIESLVFVPIMIGILFFLFEFYDDQLLAFLVLTLVWLCELFTLISVRTPISMQFFPRFFLLYFLVFHIYFFSYRYGFSYLAFSATAAFMQHLILYFWNRFEVPALQRFMRTRAQLHQQASVQITSSTIYASTLHIARVNVRGANIANDEFQGGGQDLRPPSEQANPDPGTPGEGSEAASPQEQPAGEGAAVPAAGAPLRFPIMGAQRAGAAPGFNILNPFSSLLLWLLGGGGGGGSSDGIVSITSMFRDPRDLPQVYAEATEGNENESRTT